MRITQLVKIRTWIVQRLIDRKWPIFLIWSLWLTAEYYCLGPYSYVQIHDWGDSVLPMWMNSIQEFSKYGLSYWSSQAACGFDFMPALGPLFRIETLLFFISPGWLALGLIAFIQRFIAGYFTYRLCRDCLRLGELPSLVAGLAYSLCYFYFVSSFAGEAGFPLILWSLERISQRQGLTSYLFAALLGVLVLFSSSFALSIPFILVMALAWFVLVRRLYSLRVLSLFATFCAVLLAGEIPWILSTWVQSPISQRVGWQYTVGVKVSFPWGGGPAWNFNEWGQLSRGVFDHHTNGVVGLGLVIGVLALLASRFKERRLFMVAVLLLFCTMASALWSLFKHHTNIGVLSSFQLDRFYLLAPFFAVIAAAYGLSFIRQVWLVRGVDHDEMRYSLQGLLCIIVIGYLIGVLSGFQLDRFYVLATFFAVMAAAYGLSFIRQVWLVLGVDRDEIRYSLQGLLCIIIIGYLAVSSIGIKYDHYPEWAGSSRYAMMFENPAVERLATDVDSGRFRVATVAKSLLPQYIQFYGPRPAYANAYGLETVDGYVVMYPLRYKQFWGEVISPLTTKDKITRNFFDNWSSRFYLYSPSDGTFYWTRGIVRNADIIGDNDNELEVGETWSYTATHAVTQAELYSNGGGDGFLEKTATADSDQTLPDTDDETVPVGQTPALNITKTLDPAGWVVDMKGKGITYLITVQNTGNQTLTGVLVSDPYATVAVPFSDYYNLNLLALANTKYIISELPLSDKNLKLVSSPPADSESQAMSLLDRIRRTQPLYIYENELCLPRFFVCGNATVFDNGNKLLQAMAQADIDTLRNSVFVEQEFVRNINTSLLGPSQPKIEVAQYSPDRIVLSVSLDNPGILVVSNSYNPYWKCTVNGVGKSIIPAYHTFMGVFIEGGESKVELKYCPPYWTFR